MNQTTTTTKAGPSPEDTGHEATTTLILYPIFPQPTTEDLRRFKATLLDTDFTPEASRLVEAVAILLDYEEDRL